MILSLIQQGAFYWVLPICAAILLTSRLLRWLFPNTVVARASMWLGVVTLLAVALGFLAVAILMLPHMFAQNVWWGLSGAAALAFIFYVAISGVHSARKERQG
ncbi:MAG: hypothetical protein GC190_02625 [Alphaproteobacteria bacterium]|nr:hypothetical protein [Alphaproteobacteria bacterium]